MLDIRLERTSIGGVLLELYVNLRHHTLSLMAAEFTKGLSNTLALHFSYNEEPMLRLLSPCHFLQALWTHVLELREETVAGRRRRQGQRPLGTAFLQSSTCNPKRISQFSLLHARPLRNPNYGNAPVATLELLAN
jgi:hypothetical protein